MPVKQTVLTAATPVVARVTATTLRVDGTAIATLLSHSRTHLQQMAPVGGKWPARAPLILICQASRRASS